MPARLVRQRRAAFLGGGWLEEPVSEQVSEVSQLGCDVSICSVSIRSGSGVGVWDAPGACMQKGADSTSALPNNPPDLEMPRKSKVLVSALCNNSFSFSCAFQCLQAGDCFRVKWAVQCIYYAQCSKRLAPSFDIPCIHG